MSRIPVVLAALGLVACGSEPSSPPSAPISFVERWNDVRVDQPTPPPAATPRAEIRFDEANAGIRWSAVDGVADLRVENGHLVGRSTSERPTILLETDAPLGADDQLWSVEVKLRSSLGSRTAVHPVREGGPPMPVVLERIEEWPLTSPLLAGGDVRPYNVVLNRVFTFEMPIADTAISRILLRPTNVADADFTVESLRFVFRREHLASIPAGPGWHGLGEVYREALVSRAPETLRLEVTVPEKAHLHLAVGTVEADGPSFQVTVGNGHGPAETFDLALEGPESWSESRINLGPWAGQTVEIGLSATSAEPGALAFWGAPTVRAAANGSERPQAVVVFLADTLRSDHLEAWGHRRETAPTLARLAAEGTRFEDTIAQATWTKASVSSLLTSLYPSTTGISDLSDKVSAGETTLAEAFRAAGYATFATSSVPFSGQLTNLHQGVELLYEVGASQSGEPNSKTSAFWVARYLEWLELHQDVPTFAFIHVMDPHSPFRPEAPYDTLWTEDGGAKRFAELADQVRPHIKSPLLQRFMAPSREELAAAGVDADAFVAHEKAWYDGSIRGMDVELARLVEQLDGFGLTDKTLLAFVADHGEEFLEHGRHWHGLTVYGEVANVPFALWGHGVPRGRVITETVQNVDLMPTLLDLSGLPIPERAQGRSLVPLFNGGNGSSSPPAFTERLARGGGRNGELDLAAMTRDGFKLVWNIGATSGVPEFELYDHATDPLDQNDVAGKHPEVVERMAAEIARWRTWATNLRLDESALKGEMSAEELERLRSLGYIE